MFRPTEYMLKACIALDIISDSKRIQAEIMSSINFISLIDWPYPILNILWGANELDGVGFKLSNSSNGVAGFWQHLIILSTMSPIKVKSLIISPKLKTSIGLPFNIDFDYPSKRPCNAFEEPHRSSCYK